MSNIVARLRNLGWETCYEAAAEIERLTRQVQSLLELRETNIRLTQGQAAQIAKWREENELLRANERRLKLAIEFADKVVTIREAVIEQQRAEIERLRAAAERVCRFDWSGNDNDALAAVDALRRALDERSE